MGRHRFRVREIAQQAGLSEATVDRVLNGRTGVRESTAAEVQRAVDELARQSSQLRLNGRTFMIDLVMAAPERFSGAVRRALELELPTLTPAVVRCRWHLREEESTADLVATLRRIGRRGSHGVLLKAPDDPAVSEAVDALAGQGIPVVTLVTDLPHSRRIGYVGIDNRAAGATAAYLITRFASTDQGSVLITMSSTSFRGEEERERGFRDTLRSLAPARKITVVPETSGLDHLLFGQVTEALTADPRITDVYSIGGGNRATLAAFEAAGRNVRTFVAHDLDADNTELLRRRRLSVVLHHDLRADARQACRLIMQAQGALPGRPSPLPAQVQVITPYNEPSGLTGGDVSA